MLRPVIAGCEKEGCGIYNVYVCGCGGVCVCTPCALWEL